MGAQLELNFLRQLSQVKKLAVPRLLNKVFLAGGPVLYPHLLLARAVKSRCCDGSGLLGEVGQEEISVSVCGRSPGLPCIPWGLMTEGDGKHFST